MKGRSLVTQYTLEGKYVTTYANCIEASERTGVCSRNINQVARGKDEYKPGLTRKQAGGFRWVFEGGSVMQIDIYGSSSKGNAYKVSDGKTSLLIECGLTFKKLQEKSNFTLSRV